MASRSSSTHSRKSHGSHASLDDLATHDDHESLLQRATASRTADSNTSLHDLELMQAVTSSAVATSSASRSHLDSSNANSAAANSAYASDAEESNYSEYSEYEEDEFDPEWHARQNQQAAAALLAKNNSGTFAATASSVTEKTRSITSTSDAGGGASDIFAQRPDLRQVDQSVNLMDASVGDYGELFRQTDKKRRGRKSATQSFFATAQNSLVDVFLDTSDGQKMPSFRRTLSRSTPGNNNSLRRSGTGNQIHSRRLFYGHGPPPPIREGRQWNWCSCTETCLETICKFLIIAFVVLFVVILALPQGTWWMQEKLGIINDNAVDLPSADSVDMDWTQERLESLRNMIVTHGLTTEDDLDDPASPQNQACLWLAQDDPAQLTLALQEEGMIEPHKILNRYVMATFYIALNGPKYDEEDGSIIWNETHWHDNDGWMTQDHICEWYGIECEGENHIEHFNLTHNLLKGELPSELSHMTDLILVDWSHNRISGTFPEWVGNRWKHLEYLLLERNDFEGSLPASIGDLTFLQELILPHTNLEGPIPSTLNQMTALRVLKLNMNKFQGRLPSMGGLEALEHFNVYGNALTGLLPDDLFTLTNLVAMMLDENKLEGTIPTQVGLMSRLEVFSLAKNNITGSLPDVWDAVPNLFEFRMGNNHLRGTIPQTFANLAELEILALQENPLTGTVPSELGHLERLVNLQVFHTELVGSMPEEICSLEVRRGVDLIVFGDCDDRFACSCCDRCF